MAKKIVINVCFGGFSLSPIAVKRLAELQGRDCYFFTSPLFGNYKQVTMEDCAEAFMWYAFDIPEPPKSPCAKEWSDMTFEERRESDERYYSHCLSQRDIPRDDPLLIRVVEELGVLASDAYAELKIVEIPDGVEWVINDYDGNESLEEVHRSWS